jgi:hypothetical protein
MYINLCAVLISDGFAALAPVSSKRGLLTALAKQVRLFPIGRVLLLCFFFLLLIAAGTNGSIRQSQGDLGCRLGVFGYFFLSAFFMIFLFVCQVGCNGFSCLPVGIVRSDTTSPKGLATGSSFKSPRPPDPNETPEQRLKRHRLVYLCSGIKLITRSRD